VIRHCLCLQDRYEALSRAVEDRRSLYDDASARSATLSQELEAEKNAVATTDAASVGAFREKSAAKQGIDADIRLNLAPALDRAVQSYNEAVGTYDGACGRFAFNSAVLAQVRDTLICRSQTE
jgi:hypothetical protein